MRIRVHVPVATVARLNISKSGIPVLVRTAWAHLLDVVGEGTARQSKR